MSLKHRLALVLVLIGVIVTGWTAPSEAQSRRGGGGGGRNAGGGGARPSGGGQATVARPVVGRPVVSRRVVVVGGGYYYADPFWYGYPWYGFGYGFGYPWYGYQYPIGGYPYPYPYGYRYAGPESAVRLEVTPREAEVFVDGYYAGIVDDFDGVFQRLRVPPGQHEITLYHDGYRTAHQTVYLTVDSTFKVRFTMEKLQAGDIAEPRPTPREPPPGEAGVQAGPAPNQPPGPPGPRRGPVGRRPPQGPPPPGNPRGGDTSTYGSLAIRVQPGNAAVMIDGERWEGPQGQERLVVELAEGTHHLEVQRDGFDTFSTDVTIRRGETTPLNVSLRSR